ncbi:MAG: NUDIX domain-containing protein [Lachnospiraceae bacterium]|nr:NUDIX domain-containing protein [Lachnospiraceae bacterium]
MANDCAFAKDNDWFRYRAGAILVRDGKMLFVKSMYGGYYYMVGGGVKIGETSEECVEREVFEECGARCRAERLAIVCENIFPGKGGPLQGKDCHVLEFYYLMTVPEDAVFEQANDEGELLEWIPVEDIPKQDIRPAFLRERLKEVFAGSPLMHVINRECFTGEGS